MNEHGMPEGAGSLLELLKDAHASLAIRFGTTAPYKVGEFSAERIGYAQIPSVVVTVTCRDEDVSSMVPIVRQRLYGELAERGWSADDVEFQPSVQRGRRRKFVDGNESSPTLAREKMGVEQRFAFEMGRDLARATFVGSGSFRRLPDREATDVA